MLVAEGLKATKRERILRHIQACYREISGGSIFMRLPDSNATLVSPYTPLYHSQREKHHQLHKPTLVYNVTPKFMSTEFGGAVWRMQFGLYDVMKAGP